MVRSWLFAPGHNERFLARVFDAGADEALLDLEDGVGPEFKDRARALVAEVLAGRPAWVRVNPPRSRDCALDLEAVGGLAKGLRLPKVESAADIAWVAERLHRRPVPLTASIETARGAVSCLEIAAAPGVGSLTFGNVDFAADIGADPSDWEAMLHTRSQLVLASRVASIERPSDGVYTRFTDLEGLRVEAQRAKRLGFAGKSAIHPTQVAVINEVFSPTTAELAWAREVVRVSEAASGAATRTAAGEMVDVPVVERARALLRARS